MISPFIQSHTPDNAPPGGHYSHCCTAGGFVFISGQLPITKEGVKLVNASFEEQVKQVLENINECLISVNTSRNMLAQMRVYITDVNNWPIFDKIYADWIGSHKPARAVLNVPQLHYGVAIEAEAIALVAS